MTLTKEWLLNTIAELEEERDAVPGVVNEDAANALVAMKLALASLEAKPVSVKDDMAYAFHHAISDSSLGSDEVEEIKAGLRAAFANVTAQPAPTVPDKITSANAPEVFEIAAEAERLGLRGAYASYAVGWNACRAAMLQGAGEKAELTVWYGSMPESNGKANWTAILHRKGEGRCMDGFTIDRSEYPGRVLYAADRVRYLIGAKSERPSILDYDADAHSGYVKTCNSPVIPDGWVACSERMPNDKDYVWCWGRVVGWTEDDGFEAYYDASRNKWWAVTMDGEEPVRKVTHWQPLPSPPAK